MAAPLTGFKNISTIKLLVQSNQYFVALNHNMCVHVFASLLLMIPGSLVLSAWRVLQISFKVIVTICVSLLRKSKKDYFSKLNEKQITDNKRFWKTVKPFSSNKVQFSERINLTDKNDSLLTDCGKVEKELNRFFSSVVKNLIIPGNEGCDPLSDNIFNPTLKVIAKWRNYPSILTIHFSLILFRKKMFLKK